MIKLSSLTPNPDNPRQIEQDKFEKLCNSIKRDPEFMPLNPLKIIEGGVIYAGNMRFRAIQELGMKEIPDNWVEDISHLSEEKRRRYVMIDNISYGFFDWDMVTSQYHDDELIEWGMDLPVDPIEDEPDEPPPVSHALKIQCDDLDDLITLRDMLDIDPEAKSITFGKFRMIFENRKE